MKFTFIVLWGYLAISGSLQGESSGKDYVWNDHFQVPGPYIPPRSVMDVSLIIDNKSKPKHYALLADAVQHYNLNEADASKKGLTIDIDTSPSNQEPLIASHSQYDVAQYQSGQLKPKISLSPAMLVLLPIVMLIGLVATLSFVSITGTSVSSIFKSSSQQQQQESNNNNNNANNANNVNNLMLLSSLSEIFSSNSNYPLIIINATGRNFFDRYQ